MLKKSSFRRIIVTTTALLIIALIYLFPNNDKHSYTTNLEYVNVEKTVVYLIDNNEYVARTNIVLSEKELNAKVKQIIEALTINGSKKAYIPNGFNAIIPKNTKLLDLSLDNGILKINFSKEFLNIEEDLEEKLIESIIFTLTEIEEVKQIMIFIEDNQLTTLPHSKKKLPPTLDRSFGINKEYDLSSFKDTTKTTIYYLSKHNNNYYYVPVTKVSNDQSEKVEIIINALKSAPIYQTNLISYLATNAELLNYEILENSINLSFNNYILYDFENKQILEEVKYAIYLSVKDTYNISEISFIVDNETI